MHNQIYKQLFFYEIIMQKNVILKKNVDQGDDQIYDGFLALSIFNVTSLCNIQYDTERLIFIS